MNKKRLGIWHPAMVYMLLAAAVILLAWIGSFLELRGVNTNSDLLLRSLLTADGLRYVLRKSVTSLSAAPATNILMLLFTLGIADRSTLFRTILNMVQRRQISYKQKASLLLSFAVFIFLLLFLLYGVFGTGHILLSVTGTLRNSPLADGFFVIIMLIIALPSLLYGFATDTFHSIDDCIDALVSLIRIIPSYLLTLCMASFLISVIDYTRIDVLIGIEGRIMHIISHILYWLPLPILLIYYQKSEI